MVFLVSSDNERFTADEEVVERSGLIKILLTYAGKTDLTIPLPAIQLKKVLEYCEHHRAEPLPTARTYQTCTLTMGPSEADQNFITVDQEMLFKQFDNLPLDIGETDLPIRLPTVSSSVLEKVLKCCEHHVAEPLSTADADQNPDQTRKRTTDISEWDQKFITVDPEMLFKIILAADYLLKYCKHHRVEPLPTADADQNPDQTRKCTTGISEWDEIFITVDPEMLINIIIAAYYLDIVSLLVLGGKALEKMIKGKTLKQISMLFNTINGLTPSDKAIIEGSVGPDCYYTLRRAGLLPYPWI